jgi:hypothetical protein
MPPRILTPPPVTPPRAQRDSLVVSGAQRQETPVPPTVPSSAAVDSVRELLTRATRQKADGDYAASFSSFRSAQARMATMRATFPAAPVLSTLNREYADLLRSTVNACQAFREVRISLGLPPPECNTGGN